MIGINMDNKFIFKVCVPVCYHSSNNIIGCSNELDDILQEINISVDTEELQIPEVNIIAKYYGVADHSHLPEMIKSYFNIENIIYDAHGFKVLENYFECPEDLADSCLEFFCNFAVLDSFIENYIKKLGSVNKI